MGKHSKVIPIQSTLYVLNKVCERMCYVCAGIERESNDACNNFMCG